MGKVLEPKPEKKLPSRDECIALVKKYGCHPLVLRHCEFVEAFAVKMAELAGADVELVSRGALLHDIGRCKTHGMEHALEGALIATEEGMPPEIITIIENHIGAGLSAAEAEELGLPPKDYLPSTLEERIVAHADNLARGHKKWKLDKLLKRLRRHGKERLAEKILGMHKELCQKCGADLDRLRV
jgi:uncharacterized protein (TIGR00295 family)